MLFTETELEGAFIIDIERREDERGFFARTFCQREFQQYGLNPCIAQTNISHNSKKGTLRGMHYQGPPDGEVKIITCTQGAIYDVLIDLRTDSGTFKKWLGMELTAAGHRMLYIPENFAHGFMTLEDSTSVHYMMSAFYLPESARGIRWNDPAFNIDWPVQPAVISDRDENYRDYERKKRSQ